MINLTQITNIILQILVSLCSHLALDMPIIFGLIFTCFVSSVSLTLIYLLFQLVAEFGGMGIGFFRQF